MKTIKHCREIISKTSRCKTTFLLFEVEDSENIYLKEIPSRKGSLTLLPPVHALKGMLRDGYYAYTRYDLIGTQIDEYNLWLLEKRTDVYG